MRQLAFLTESGDGTIDDVGFDGAHSLVIEPEPLHNAGAKAFHKHIGLGNEIAEGRFAILALQIERNRALASVEIGEPHRVFVAPISRKGRLRARRIPGGRLHLDHVRALIRHHHAHHRTW